MEFLTRVGRFLFVALVRLSPAVLTLIRANVEQSAKQALKRSPPLDSENRFLAAPEASEPIPGFPFSRLLGVHKASLVRWYSVLVLDSDRSRWQRTQNPE